MKVFAVYTYRALPCVTVVLCMAMLLMLSGCFPLKVKDAALAYESRSAAVGSVMDYAVGPDIHMKDVHDFTKRLSEYSDKVDPVDIKEFWEIAFEGREKPITATFSQLLEPDSRSRLWDRGFRHIILLPPKWTVTQDHDGPTMPFYMRSTETTTREAVLVTLSEHGHEEMKLVVTATAEARWVWIPFGPLLFIPLYSEPETDKGALEKLAEQMTDYLLSKDAGFTVRVSVIATQ